MGNVSITEIFSKLLSNKDFEKQYLLAFLDRFVYSATDLEGGLTKEERKKAIENLLEASNFLMGLSTEKMSPMDIVTVADSVNKDAGVEGLRKINVSAGKYAQWTPVAPNKIYYALYSLFDNYYNVWTYLDVYLKEAKFHIDLMRIHPFEDGNKRCAKLILNSNLVKQNFPPVIITAEETEIYYDFINNCDYEGFAKFLKLKSVQELHTVMSYYKLTNNIPISDSLVDNIIDEPTTGGRK